MSQKQVKKRRVDLDSLSLGLDMSTGKVVIGVADKKGTILEKNAKDVSEDFYHLMYVVIKVREEAEKKKAEQAAKKDASPPQPGVVVEEGVSVPENSKPKIVLPSAGEVAAAGKMRRAKILPFEIGKRS